MLSKIHLKRKAGAGGRSVSRLENSRAQVQSGSIFTVILPLATTSKSCLTPFFDPTTSTTR